MEWFSLGQGNCLACFHPRSGARQGNHNHCQKAEYCQGNQGFDHLRLLTVAVSRSRRARGAVDNSHDVREFREYNPTRTFIVADSRIAGRRAKTPGLRRLEQLR
jgi:hypothetical protein